MTHHDTKSKAKPEFVHLMYFVDSKETKSLSLRISHIKLLFFLVFSFILFSFLSLALIALLINNSRHASLALKELKSAHLAQSIVHENLLKEAPFLIAAGSNIILSRQSSQVAAAFRDGTTVDFNSDELAFSDPSVDSPPESITESGSQPESQADSQSESLQNSSPAGESNNQAPNLKNSEPISQDQGDQMHSEIEIENQASQNRLVSFSEIDSTYLQSEKKVSLKFTIKNETSTARQLDGVLCALIHGRSPAGEAILLSYPTQFKGENTNRASCRKGLRIRFARFRPTEIIVNSDPITLERVVFYFFTKESVSIQELRVQ